MVPLLWKAVWQFFRMLKKELLAVPLLCMYPEELKTEMQNVYTSVHSSITHKSPKVETAQMCASRRMGKQDVAYTYNGIFSLKKVGNSVMDRQ